MTPDGGGVLASGPHHGPCAGIAISDTPNPPERSHQIEHADIGAIVVAGSDPGEIEEPERTSGGGVVLHAVPADGVNFAATAVDPLVATAPAKSPRPTAAHRLSPPAASPCTSAERDVDLQSAVAIGRKLERIAGTF